MALFLLLFIAPLIWAAWLSLTQDLMVGGVSFVGLENYFDALTDADFGASILRVLGYAAIQVPLILGVALAAALALDSGRLPGASFFRIGIFLPYAVPGVVAALLWGYIYGGNFGLVGSLRDLGLAVPDPLSPDLILGAMANIGFWLYVGYSTLIYQAALKAIPTELYEAAEIDGAGPLRTIWSIKLPALRPALGVTGMFSIIGAMQLFGEPNVLRPLAPNAISSSYTPNVYAYNLAFSGNQFSYSATISILMGILTVVTLLVLQRLTRRKEAAR